MQAAVPKQYLPLLGRPILVRTLERLCTHPRLQGVLVGIAANDDHWSRCADDCSHLPRFVGTFTGGSQRAQTVLSGLRALASRARAGDWVMVHDAVRPCVRHDDIDKLIDAVVASDQGGLLALPIADTVKRTDASGRVLETVARNDLCRALTPQMFRLDRLQTALEQALADGFEITDEAAAIEHIGGRPLVVAGHPDNIKITHPADLDLAELYLYRQARELT